MSILHILLESMIDTAAEKWTSSLSQDGRDDPVYKKKLQELIERNRKFEEERERREENK
jgi:hypothetical protein